MRSLVRVIAVLAAVLVACGSSEDHGATVIAGQTSTSTSVDDTGPRTTASTGGKERPGGVSTTATDRTTTSRGQGPDTTNPHETTTATGRSTTTSSGPSALKRRDVPPGAVPAQFPATPPTTIPACGVPQQQSTPAIRDSGAVEIATTMEICFPGFAPSTPVDVTVTPASGAVRYIQAAQFAPGGTPYMDLAAVPGDVVGTYTIEARQGSLRAKGTFVVQRATRLHVLVLPPKSGPPGTAFRLAFAGLPPGSSVRLSLYAGSLSVESRYLTELGTATMDHDGQAIFELPTQRDDPPGAYCVAYRTSADQQPGSCAAFFEVRR